MICTVKNQKINLRNQQEINTQPTAICPADYGDVRKTKIKKNNLRNPCESAGNYLNSLEHPNLILFVSTNDSTTYKLFIS